MFCGGIDGEIYDVVWVSIHITYGFTRFTAAPRATILLLRNHALMRSTFVLSCLDERTACIYIISSDVCAFS